MRGSVLAALVIAVVSCGGGGVGGCPNPCGLTCCPLNEVCNNGTCTSPNQCASPCGGACCQGQEQCVNGACCVPCGGACCGNGDTCLNGSCCAADKVCGSTCCNQGAICIVDKAGNKACAVACQTNNQCGGQTPCCVLLNNDTTTGACVANGLGSCRCATGAECASGACAPVVSNDVVAAKVYVCKANDGAAWHGCNGSVTCANGYDCWIDGSGNHFCARSCNNDSQCGNAGVACCNTQAKCDNAVFSCGGAGGCMTCP